MEKNFLDLLQLLNASKSKYMLIGGYAVGIHSEPRYTKDLDIWIDCSKPNAKKILKLLTEYGAPTDNLSEKDLATPGLIFIFGIAPQRVDIINHIKGADFKSCYARRVRKQVGKTEINVVSIKDLINLKKLAGRDQDKIDIAKLKKFS
jgi:hypothetical protein